MGRITIFTREDCCFCHRAMKELQHRCLPFVEIPLTRFPERRIDMMELSGKMTVPQLFLNQRWLGGCDDLMALLEEWDTTGSYWHVYLQEVASKEDPMDPRLAHPMTPLGLSEERMLQKSSYHPYGDHSSSHTDGDATMPGIPLPDGTWASVGHVTRHLLIHDMPRQKLAYLAKYYSNCFAGDKGVEALLRIFPALNSRPTEKGNRKRAVEFGRLLQKFGILHHVCNDHDFKDSPNYYYRLQPFHQPHVLNSFQSQQQVLLMKAHHHQFNNDKPATKRLPSPEDDDNDVEEVNPAAEDNNDSGEPALPPHLLDHTYTTTHWSSSESSFFIEKVSKDIQSRQQEDDEEPPILTARGALKLLTKLQKLLADIEVRATGRDGIDYLQTKNYEDQAFYKLEEASCQLQCLDGLALAMTMNDTEKTVFGIHLYNTMVRHANIKVGVPTTASHRRNFFTSVYYKVANQILSLDDVEHGILRGNKRHPYHLQPQFVGNDPRKAWACRREPMDPRIHFALYCGAHSCPPINHYTVENLDAELQLAAQSFCLDDANVVVDETTNTLTLSMIFKWYKSDFGATTSQDLPPIVLGFLPKQSEKYAALQSILMHGCPSRRRFSTTTTTSDATATTTISNNNNNIKVKFMPYDWAPQAAPGKFLKFSTANLKTTETSLRAPFSKKATAKIRTGRPIPLRSTKTKMDTIPVVARRPSREYK